MLCISLSLLLLLLCGDIHQNPGPYRPEKPCLSICHINARSLAKPGRIDDLYELVNHILIHLFLITKLIYPIIICVDLTKTGQVAASLYMFAILILLSIVKIYHNLRGPPLDSQGGGGQEYFSNK